jgi:diacylglycerol kinase
MSRRPYFRREAASFACAFRGLGGMLRSEPHARFHLAATVAVVAAGWWVGLCGGQWVALVLSIGLVWTAETLNTAVELLADLVHPAEHDGVRRLKDLAAGAVLLASFTALVVGLLVFGPWVAGWFGG